MTFVVGDPFRLFDENVAKAKKIMLEDQKLSNGQSLETRNAPNAPIGAVRNRQRSGIHLIRPIAVTAEKLGNAGGAAAGRGPVA
ncbi:hypothetical protein EVAR_62588_1 [Eumeta japonica]|uniref:Uncharacterized protein n=1 Tax=Eumeta variegata TaxID=151549 RepID=A0A4C1YBA4_EUMVA|nr:hypothetical protein EVAR_62588_1 [Eumeta japonica]